MLTVIGIGIHLARMLGAMAITRQGCSRLALFATSRSCSSDGLVGGDQQREHTAQGGLATLFVQFVDFRRNLTGFGVLAW